MIPETLREAARRFGDSVAFVTPRGWPITYGELDRASDEAAVGLVRRGVGEGDRVGLVLPPGIEYLVAYLAAAKVGAITAGVNDKLAPPERARILELADPALVITAPGRTDWPHPTEEHGAAASASDLLAGLRVVDAAPAPLPPDPDRPVAIIFTSGTTGTPKGALYGNRQLRFITDTDVGDAWGTGGRSYNGTSSATLGFMTKLPGNLRRGGCAFMMERWSARATLELVARERMTNVGGVPTQLALMLRDPDFDGFDLASVRSIVVGGAPITPGLAEEARARFRAPLASRYSCTEAGIGLGTALDDPEEDAVVSVGHPLPGVELAMLDDDDRPVPPGEIGAVCLRSPAAMSGYWRDPAGTRAAFTADGFVRTGDLGWVDDRGRLHLVGRSKEMYVRGGYNVYPVEVEAVLSTAPTIAAVAVATRPDPVMGEIGVACVVPRDRARPPTLEELRTFAADRLAKHKLPEALLVVDALPLTAAEKVDRRALARLAHPDT
ncbi:MAG: acyl--CoA ligase [Actinobacteria bacterium]|nr:acyl--CoA ligase [Actinomycetota bacterium]